MQKGSLIILDLNGLLITRTYAGGQPAANFADGIILDNHVVALKAGALDAIDRLLERGFAVAVWSSIKQYNLDKLLPHVVGQRPLLFVWGQERCWRLGDEFLKPLEAVWKEYPQYDALNTLLVDDAEAKCAKNPPECCLVTGDMGEVEARVEKENEPVEKQIYTVTFTEFLDDYKARGSDWSETTEPALFSTREYAEEYVSDVLRDYVVEHVNDVGNNIRKKIMDRFCLKTKNLANYFSKKADDDDVEACFDEFFAEGEFVPKCFDWDISTTTVDSTRKRKR